MKVYVVLQKVDYEGESIEQVFSTKEKAEKLRQELEDEEERYFRFYVVEEYEVF